LRRTSGAASEEDKGNMIFLSWGEPPNVLLVSTVGGRGKWEMDQKAKQDRGDQRELSRESTSKKSALYKGEYNHKIRATKKAKKGQATHAWG